MRARVVPSHLALLAMAAACSDVPPPFSAAVTYPIDPNPQASAVTDVNGDGKLDVVFATTNGPGVLDVLLGNGDGALGAKLQAHGASNLVGLAIADFDGDQHPDLASSESAGSSVEVFLGTAGDGTFGAPVVSSVGASCHPRDVVAADFDLDGKPDLVVRCDQSSNLVVLLGAGSGSFAAPQQISAGARAVVALATADMNQDGTPDLVVGTYGTDAVGEVGFLLGAGNGTFGPPAAIPLGGQPTIAVADVNADGRLDVVARFGLECQVVLQDAQGSFSTGVTFSFGRAFDTNALVLADLDGDGRPDLAATNPKTGDISVVKGDGAGGFGAEQVIPVGSNATALSSGDLNGDGRPDFVAGDAFGDKAYVLLAR